MGCRAGQQTLLSSVVLHLGVSLRRLTRAAGTAATQPLRQAHGRAGPPAAAAQRPAVRAGHGAAAAAEGLPRPGPAPRPAPAGQAPPAGAQRAPCRLHQPSGGLSWARAAAAGQTRAACRCLCAASVLPHQGASGRGLHPGLPLLAKRRLQARRLPAACCLCSCRGLPWGRPAAAGLGKHALGRCTARLPR